MFGGMGSLFSGLTGDKNNGILDSFSNSFGGAAMQSVVPQNNNSGGFLDSLSGLIN